MTVGSWIIWFVLHKRDTSLVARLRAETTDPNALVLEELAAAGADPAKEQRLEFWLIFPTESAALEAANRIRSMGLEAEAMAAPPETNWVCLASKSMVPHS